MRLSFMLLIALLTIFPNESQACVKSKAQRVLASSNLRQVAIALNTLYFTQARVYNQTQLVDMQTVLTELARIGFNDSSVILSPLDLDEIEAKPPRAFAHHSKETTQTVFESAIFDFPIAFSMAIYPDPISELPASQTPLLWTRGLHNYESFDSEYGGHVAFLDGHVVYFEGSPKMHDPDLVAVFDPNGTYGKAIRVLEHEPTLWSDSSIQPLPVRYSKQVNPPYRHARQVAYALTFPLILGLAAACFPGTIKKRLWNALVTATVTGILQALLIPAIC